MFKKILFTTTASPLCDLAAEAAFGLAGKYGASVKVLHVYGVPGHGFNSHVKAFREGNGEVNDSAYETRLADEIRAHRQHLMAKVPACEVVVTPGVPQTEILRLARKWESDLIVMGPHTRKDKTTDGLEYRNTVGNTMHKVVQNAKAPVLMIGSFCRPHPWHFKNVIFGTDLSRDSDIAFAFALKAAKEFGAKLTVFHALAVAEEPESPDLLEKRLDDARARIQSRHLSGAGDFSNLEIEVCEGAPYVEILKITRQREGDLIVLAHHGKRAGGDPDRASIVEHVVLRASCPVVSVNHEEML